MKQELRDFVQAALRGGANLDQIRAAVGHDVDVLREACSCPSGNGSLRNPCAVHPQAAPVDALAQFIRMVDGNHSMGAGALAEAICGRFTILEIAS